MRNYIYIFIVFLLFSCVKNNNYNVLVRKGYSFYSISFDSDGKGIIERGKSSYCRESFKIDTILISQNILIEDLEKFTKELNNIKDDGKKGNILDSPRVEILLNNRVVYDTYIWDSKTWSLIKPIAKSLPENINPFVENSKW